MTDPSTISAEELASRVRPWIASPFVSDLLGVDEAIKALDMLRDRAAALEVAEEDLRRWIDNYAIEMRRAEAAEARVKELKGDGREN